MKWAEVAVNFPHHQSILTYKVPDKLSVKRGNLVNIPLGKRMEVGCLLSFVEEPEQKNIKFKEINSVHNQFVKLNEKEIELFNWIAKYYQYSLGKLIFDCLPKFMKKVNFPKYQFSKSKSKDVELNDEITGILDTLEEKEFYSSFNQGLVYGITGSGKSLLYLNIIKKVLQQKQSVLFLIPEINLSPQFIKFFTRNLNCKVYVYHSAVTAGEKYNLWNFVKKLKEPVLIVGVRSSVFLPIKNLGLIVVDEEHDSSFKQDDRCKFNARDVAIKKAQIHDIPIFLGSATPSLESYYRHKNGNMDEGVFYFELTERFNKSQLPDIQIIPCGTNDDYCWPLNPKCIKETDDVIARNGKVIYFVNKLGFAKYMQCQECRHTFECANCSTPLTYFQKTEKLECRQCFYSIEVPKECPECGCLDIDNKGFGTEKIETLLNSIYPDTEVIRFDRDEVKKVSDVNRALDHFNQDEPAIMVGTQMLSKGHNFKNVQLVVVLGMDNQFHYPDFRANERIFQMATQVAGRAGRFGGESKVLIQSNIDSPMFDFIIKNDLHSFYESEQETRQILKLPPFEKLATVNFISNQAPKAKADAEKAFERLADTVEKHGFKVELKGPRSQYIEKIKNTFCWKIILSAGDHNELSKLLQSLKAQFKLTPGVRIQIDIDPIFMD